MDKTFWTHSIYIENVILYCINNKVVYKMGKDFLHRQYSIYTVSLLEKDSSIRRVAKLRAILHVRVDTVRVSAMFLI